MNIILESQPLPSGLYLVGTPIGNLRDITLRALETLSACDALYCEDTRVTGKLLKAYGISKKMEVFTDHSSDKIVPNYWRVFQKKGKVLRWFLMRGFR